MMAKAESINENLTILQNEGSLAFGTDAYLLFAYMRRAAKENACEFGAGSGVISLLTASKQKFGHITAMEVQENIAALAKQNVEKNGFSEKIDVICTDIRHADKKFNGNFASRFDKRHEWRSIRRL